MRLSTTSVLPGLLTLRMEDAGAASLPLSKLTSGLARGDDQAWSEFHRSYGPAIFRRLLAATRGDHDLAGEALQQTYLRVARHARPCDCERSFQAWLCIVGRTALSDCRRRRMSFWQLLRRRREDPTDVETDCPDAEASRQLETNLDAALAAIGADDRALLEAKYLEGDSVRTLAEKLGISEKAAESRLTRARAGLRRHLIQMNHRHE